ncbi:MAG TPA: BlaI/MecI/CopY family transcriptional regulator [Candidatus Eisenbacteria bacterium]|nr:BlaI/MecI/CopY family transcriptional regulator [Candidatus Eisenbacteria bacterium]
MKRGQPELSRRERQIMDVLHRRGSASAADVRREMHDPPTYSAVRALLRVLEQKGRVTHTEVGRTYVYRPTTSPSAARRAALEHMVSTFFGGSAEEAAAALLDLPGDTLDTAARRRIAQKIAAAKREGR